MDWLTPLQARCTPGDLKLDIGANEGGYTYLMLQTPGLVHAFEAIPQLAEQVRARFVNEPRVTVFPQGVSDQVFRDEGYGVFEAWTLDKPERARRGRNAHCVNTFGPDLFAIDFTTVNRHLLDVGHPSVAYKVAEVDAAGTVTRHTAHWAFDRVGFLKVDVDGYELRVLRGATHVLQHDRPPLLIELGYLVNDIGDSHEELLNLIYHAFDYVLVEDDGNGVGVRRDRSYWADHYPLHTTFDVGMVPAESDYFR